MTSTSFDGPVDTAALRSVGPVYWMGALSFETRCTGSLRTLVEAGVEIRESVIFDYPTKLTPRSDGEQHRAINREDFRTLLKSQFGVRAIHPHRYAEFVGELQRVAREVFTDPSVAVILDITCLTKIHTLAAAYWLFGKALDSRLILAYSRPDHYGTGAGNMWGKGKWLRTVLTCLDLESTEEFFATNAVALLGHEGDRLRLALSECEPSEALIIRTAAQDPHARDLDMVTDAQNARLLLEIQREVRPSYQVMTIGANEYRRYFELIRSYAQDVARREARIVLCPFGPKPFVFLAGLACLTTYPGRTWLSYPIAAAHQVAYSTGYHDTMWIEPKSLI